MLRIAVVLCAACLSLPAEPLTPGQVLQLHRAGVCDAILVSWIRAEGACGIDAPTIFDLQRQGVSPAVAAELMRQDSARLHPRPAGRSVLIVANRSGAPLSLRTDVEARQVLLFTHPRDGATPIAEGTEVRIPVDARRLEVTLDEQPTRAHVDPPAAGEARLEVLPAAKDGLRARVVCAGMGAFEGDLRPDPRDAAAVRGRRPGPPAAGDPTELILYQCPGHPEMWARTPGKCPLCGQEMQQVR